MFDIDRFLRKFRKIKIEVTRTQKSAFFTPFSMFSWYEYMDKNLFFTKLVDKYHRKIH